MKKLLLSVALVAAGFAANAQVYYSASNATDFFAGSILEIDGDTNNWSALDYSAQTNWNLPAELTNMGEVLFSESWNGNDLTPDNVYLTPPINLTTATGNLTLSYIASSPDPTSDNFYHENYSVYVFDGLSGAQAALVGTPALTEVLSAGQTGFFRTIDVSSFAGADSLFIAFHHYNCTGQWILAIDDIKVQTTNSINENVIEASVYPNPANDVLNVKIEGTIESVVVSTMDGKVVAKSTSSNVNVNELSAGLYIYTVTTTEGKVATGNFAKK